MTGRYVMPVMRHGEQDCFSFSLSAWAAVIAWTVTRLATRGRTYRP